MTTEYYQIPSQQGFLPLESGSSADPWLAAATSTLSISDWSPAAAVAGKSSNKQSTTSTNPPSLFEPEDAEASVSWNHVVPLQYEVKAPVAPKKFNTSSSKLDAWSVVDTNTVPKQQQQRSKLTKATTITTKVVQVQVQQQQQQQQVKPASPKQQQPINKTLQPAAVAGVEEKPIEDELTAQNRYKTELCKSFTETGACRYGNKCQFAHGKEEIRPILRHPKYKTEICKTFHTTGTCPYGIRCRFIHTRSKEEAAIVIAKHQQQQRQQEEEEEDADDDAVPQWSKSWTMSLASAVPSKNTSSAVVAPEPAF